MIRGRAVVMKKENWASYINLKSGDKGTIRKIMFIDPENIDE